MSPTARTSPGRERGSAVLAAVLVSACVAVLAVQAARTSRSEMAAVSAEATHARLAADADAGVAMAVQGLSDPDPTVRWAPDAAPHSLSYDGAELTVTVEDERAKVPLDSATSSQLTALFTAAGADAATASSLAAAIVAGRDPTRGGAPLESVDALRQLDGMTPELYTAVKPSVTVDAGDVAFDPRYATPLALAVMGGSADSPAVIERAREQAGERPALDTAPPPSLSGRVMTLRVDATEGRGRVSRATVIQLTANPLSPYVVRRQAG